MNNFRLIFRSGTSETRAVCFQSLLLPGKLFNFNTSPLVIVTITRSYQPQLQWKICACVVVGWHNGCFFFREPKCDTKKVLGRMCVQKKFDICSGNKVKICLIRNLHLSAFYSWIIIIIVSGSEPLICWNVIEFLFEKNRIRSKGMERKWTFW